MRKNVGKKVEPSVIVPLKQHHLIFIRIILMHAGVTGMSMCLLDKKWSMIVLSVPSGRYQGG